MEWWAWFLSGLALGYVAAWVLIAVIVVGEVSLLAVLGLRGSQRPERNA